jgi:hypothetical protein
VRVRLSSEISILVPLSARGRSGLGGCVRPFEHAHTKCASSVNHSSPPGFDGISWADMLRAAFAISMDRESLSPGAYPRKPCRRDSGDIHAMLCMLGASPRETGARRSKKGYCTTLSYSCSQNIGHPGNHSCRSVPVSPEDTPHGAGRPTSCWRSSHCFNFERHLRPIGKERARKKHLDRRGIGQSTVAVFSAIAELSANWRVQ